MLTIYTVLLLFGRLAYSLACMRVSAPDGVIPIEMVPTTTTALTTTRTPDCPEASDMASIFISNNVELEASIYGIVSPVGMCTTCRGGTVNYYDSASTAVPHAIAPFESAGSLTAMVCPDMCICATDGTCYMPTDRLVTATLWPYCSGGTCGTYVLITADSDSSGFVALSGSPTFTSGDQSPSIGEYSPVTDPSYINAATISCEGCVPVSCQTTSP
uniref:Secreted protein n=1 Tax=Panagrellus redivivus TaxID=6233 RepID=A0A7E4W3Y2_PANRE